MTAVNGKILKGIAGFYYVYADGIGVVECKAKGLFRNQGVKPLPGDLAELEISDYEKLSGNITEILPRKNSLIRPAVANVDQVLVFFAVKDPDPHLNLLDRFLISMEKNGLPVYIIFNKTDLGSEDEVNALRNIYENAGYRTFGISAGKGIGREEVISLLEGKTSVIAGPSGVGKSTFMNLINPEALSMVGELSEKIKRGKNTTRHTELFPIGKDSYLIDTPGFSSFYIDDVAADELDEYYPEIKKYEPDCRFAGCSHLKEQDCGVRKALAEGLVAPERYENYCRLYTEAVNRKRY